MREHTFGVQLQAGGNLMQEEKLPDGTFTEKRVWIDRDAVQREVKKAARKLRTDRAPIFHTRREREAVNV